jgi:hypothetical protein
MRGFISDIWVVLALPQEEVIQSGAAEAAP